ncbi:PREDICTED: SORBI_3003G102400 [Prunus dulcis]|uniref:PREDICTED: SORBI_3003G102400 n=1 Tax=Prunus dulcis TaxID=3755 RepID=A0A5E4G7B9_PRUDU|nr:uncharacterized protein LOC117624022 [Prunus dulcis]VVA35442.1 PREDICTED: SORBI_3003G102400 [Prunus dulcis]
MENGHDWKIAEKFSGLTISGADPIRSSNNSTSNQDGNLLQVMKAMEAAEATIKQQVEENIRLRTQLEHKMLELHRYKLQESMPTQMPPSVDPWAQRLHGSHDQAHQPVAHVDNQIDRIANPAQIHRESETRETQLGSSEINGAMKVVRVSGNQVAAENASSGISRLSSPSTTTSLSPGRSSTEGEYDPQRVNFSGHGLMPLTERNNPSNSLWKKDLVVKVHEHEQEIMQLRKHLADYSIKEAQIRNEKYVLEKRIAYMRLAFDQQQQDLADAASKALSYRQDIIEENIRLAYAVQDAQQERSTFVSSLLPILAEYSLQPPVPDAQSIVGNVKVLFRHLQEKLLLTESKLKELQYQLTPWRSDSNQQPNNISIAAPPSPPSQSIGGGALLNVSRNGLEMVPQNQPTYASNGGRVPASASDTQTTADWDHHPQSGFGGGAPNNVETNDLGLGRYSPVPSRTSAGQDQDVPLNLAVTQGDTQRVNQYSGGTSNRQVTFRDPVGNTHREMDDQYAEGNQNDRENSSNWSAGNSPYTSPLNDSSSPYPHYLPPVLEEGGSSSYSEAADDDPLPAIEGLQISGEAFPGHELQACGYSINGTTSCNFEWVRHMQDGSVNYIDGAKQPNYLVTADDVDTYLAIEVQPLDNRKRKGELVKVFANEHKKITCDTEMQGQIEKILYKGQASFKIFQFAGYLDIWEPATLAIKRGAYSIKGSGGTSGSGVVVTEKFSPNTFVTIPYGSPAEFIIVSGSDGGGGGNEYLLRADNESCCRDTVVLTLRLFIHRADVRKNSRRGKKMLFF